MNRTLRAGAVGLATGLFALTILACSSDPAAESASTSQGESSDAAVASEPSITSPLEGQPPSTSLPETETNEEPALPEDLGIFDQAGTAIDEAIYIPDPASFVGSGTLTIEGTELEFDVYGCNTSTAIHGYGVTDSGIPYEILLDTLGLSLRVGYDPAMRDISLFFYDALFPEPPTQNAQLDPSGHVDGSVLLVRNDILDSNGNTRYLEFLGAFATAARRGEDTGAIVDQFVANGDAFLGDVIIDCEPS